MWGITTTNKARLKIDKCTMSKVPSNPLQKIKFYPQKTKAPDQKTKTVFLRFIGSLRLQGVRVARFNSIGGMPQKE
jgi:hypothetical protein